MAINYTALKAADAALPGAPLPISEAAVALNAQTVVSPAINLAWSSLREVLMNAFDWGSLVQVATLPIGATLPGGGTQTAPIQAAAIGLRDCALYGDVFNAANAAVWARLTAATGRLTPTAVGAITTASAAAILAMQTPTIAVWSPPVTAGDVQTARAQP